MYRSTVSPAASEAGPEVAEGPEEAGAAHHLSRTAHLAAAREGPTGGAAPARSSAILS